MRFKTGLVVGFAAGYYLGARAGRERYVQIEQMLDRARETEAFQQARARVQDVVDDLATNAKQVLAEAMPGAEADRPSATPADIDLVDTWGLEAQDEPTA